MKDKILKRILIIIVGLAAVGLAVICIIDRNNHRYDGKYVFAGENDTRVVEVQEDDDVLYIKYISSKYGQYVSNVTIYDEIDEAIDDSWTQADSSVDYREYYFKLPIDLASGAVRFGKYDEYGGFYTYVYMCFSDNGIYLSEEDPYIYPLTEPGSADIDSNPGNWSDYVYWNYAGRTGYDTEQIIAVIKCALVAVFVVAGVVLAAVYIRRNGKTQQIITMVVMAAYGVAAHFILLAPSCQGNYIGVAAEGIMTGEEIAEFIDYGDSGILMIEYIESPEYSEDSDVELIDYDMSSFYIPVIFSKDKGEWYSVDGDRLKLFFNERVTVNTQCRLKETFTGIKLTLDDDVRGVSLRCDFERQGIYRISAQLGYLILIPAVVMAVFIIMGEVKRIRERRLNPQYPYGQYVMKQMVYINPDMEYMRDYLIRNLSGVKVLWQNDNFSVNDSVNPFPVYELDTGKDVLSVLCGMKHCVDITINRLKGSADSYRLAYNKKKTVLANVIDDKVVAAFELEVCHE